jgi:hypothetical protein
LDLLLHELACLRAGFGVMDEEVSRISHHVRLFPLRAVLALMSRLNRLQAGELDRLLQEERIPLVYGDAPCVRALWCEARHRRENSGHDCVVQTATLGILRRLAKELETACDALSEATALVGWTKLGDHLGNWSGDWRHFERQLRQETLRVAVEAYIADADRDLPRNYFSE